jgi:hypothetical protein
MINPKEEYKQSKNIKDIYLQSNNILYNKYINLNIKGDKKIDDLDSTNQESLLASLNGGGPVPGMIYTFIYKGELERIRIGSKDELYIDIIPLVFCCNNHPNYFSGINFNMIPELVRVKFLQAYFEKYESFLEDVETITQNNKIAINKQFLGLVQGGGLSKLLMDFSQNYDANFAFPFRRYSKNRVDRLRMIEYNEWKYIPFFKSEHPFKNVSEKQVQNEYYKNSKV